MQNVTIFLSSDNNYAPFVATTIASICDNTESFIDFYILDGGITKENQDKIKSLKNQFNNFSIEFIQINNQDNFKNIQLKRGLSLAAYSRLLIPNIKPNIKKAIYLDVDVIVKGDISELFNEPLDDFAIGAVQDFTDKISDKNNKVEKIKKASEIGKYSCYFNSGVLLIDCDIWRNTVNIKDLLDIEEKYRSTRIMNDQDVLNKYFENNYKILDSKYNFYNQDIEDTNTAEFAIRHFVGHTKPWHIAPIKNKIMPKNISDFWHYAKQTPFYEILLTNCKIKEAGSKRLVALNAIIEKNKENSKLKNMINKTIY